jgi:hypothetical protein
MKRALATAVILLTILVAYAIWPFVGLVRLADRTAAGDVAAVAHQVDFVRLRQSLTAQIVAAYLRLSGRTERFGPLSTALAASIGTTVADPILADLLTPDNLTKLLRGESVRALDDKIAVEATALPRLDLGNALRAWWNADYGIGRFALSVPFEAAADDRFQLHLSLQHGRWMLTGLDLSASLQTRLARALIARSPR